jgi:hypothetical protein
MSWGGNIIPTQPVGAARRWFVAPECSILRAWFRNSIAAVFACVRRKIHRRIRRHIFNQCFLRQRRDRPKVSPKVLSALLQTTRYIGIYFTFLSLQKLMVDYSFEMWYK